MKTGISSDEYILDNSETAEEKKNSPVSKDKTVSVEYRGYVPNKAHSVSFIAASSSFEVHILFVQVPLGIALSLLTV